MLDRANAWIKGHFVSALLLTVVLGALFPAVGLSLKDLEFFRVPRTSWTYDFPSLALGLMMLSASTQTRVKDFGQLVKRPRAGLAGLAVIYAVVPLIVVVVGIVWSHFAGGQAGVQVQIGLLLSALMPVAMTASVWVRINSGNQPLLVSLITLTTALAIASVPLYLTVLLGVGGLSVAVPSESIVEQLVTSVTLPLALGLLARWFAPRLVEKWQGLFAVLGHLSLWGAVLANVAVAAPHLSTEGPLFASMLVLTVALNGLCFWIGIVASRWLGLSREDAIALIFSSGMRSNSTGLLLGLKSFPGMPLVSVPAALFMISQHVIGAYLTRALEQAGNRVLGHSIALEPRSLEAYLERALPPGGQRAPAVTLFLFRLAVPGANRPGRVGALVKRLRPCLRMSDFVCLLPPDGFGVVLVNAHPRGSALVAERLVRAARAAEPGILVSWGSADAGKEAATSASLMAAAESAAAAPTARA
ncbi:MAG: bile acid:sodium symporter family protein [Myxococcaceae bacterium]